MIKNKVANGLLAAGVIGGGLLGGAVSMAGVGAESAAVQSVTASPQQDGDTGTTEGRQAEHATRLAEALAPLVEDGTITQEQADAVAAQLAESAPKGRRGPGGDGAMMSAVEETLGLGTDELRELLRDGNTLAEVAEQQGVSVDDLSAAMSSALSDSLAEKVADGSITQERADEILADAGEHITSRINGEGPPGHGHRGPGPGAGDGSPDEGVN